MSCIRSPQAIKFNRFESYDGLGYRFTRLDADVTRPVLMPFGGHGRTFEIGGLEFYVGGSSPIPGGGGGDQLVYSDANSARTAFGQVSGDGFALNSIVTNCDSCVILGETDSGSISTTDQSDLGGVPG